jgi:hypothetical protein
MDPTRHITYEETKILNWPYFILEKKKMDPSRHIMKKKFLDWSFSFFFLENKINLDLSCLG